MSRPNAFRKLELERKQDLGHIRQQKQILVDRGGLSQTEVVCFMQGIRKQSCARNADVEGCLM